jgi:VanZ family protein
LSRLLIVVLALIVYGSLYPFRFSSQGANPLGVLIDSWNPKFYLTQRVDILINIALYLPVGICGYLAFRRSRGRLFALTVPVLIGFVVSVSVELTQVFEAVRKPSVTDVMSNTFGAAAGVVSGSLVAKMSTRLRSIDPSAYLVLACWLGSLLFPFWPVFAMPVLRMKLRLLLTSDPFTMLSLLGAFASWYLAGFLLTRAGVRRPAAWLALSVGVLPAQLLIYSRQPAMAHLLGAIAGLVAFSLTKARYRALVAVAFVGVMILRGLAPFHWRPDPAAFGWMPFAALIEANWQNAILVLLDKMYYCSAAIWSVCFAGVRLRSAVLSVAGLLLFIETAQTFLPGRTPDITDPILALLIGLAIDAFRRTSSLSGTSA